MFSMSTIPLLITLEKAHKFSTKFNEFPRMNPTKISKSTLCALTNLSEKCATLLHASYLILKIISEIFPNISILFSQN